MFALGRGYEIRAPDGERCAGDSNIMPRAARCGGVPHSFSSAPLSSGHCFFGALIFFLRALRRVPLLGLDSITWFVWPFSATCPDRPYCKEQLLCLLLYCGLSINSRGFSASLTHFLVHIEQKTLPAQGLKTDEGITDIRRKAS